MSANGTPVVTIAGSVLTVASPYHPQFPARAKALGGRFNGNDKTWQFDARDESRVREMVIDIFGTDGSTGVGDLVTVRVRVNDYGLGDTLFVAGRQVARRPGRDMPVRLGDGVVIVSGGFAHSGGSQAKPRLAAHDNTVLEIRDLPRAIAEREGLEIVEITIDRAALMAEREKLIARLAEIDALLA
ncbi:MAG: hypothetical protein NAOJABEB_03328 [Steroidobacteraceae bacterium]|nr:hypothetical protein [Steroidobacteraceae bacterium]